MQARALSLVTSGPERGEARIQLEGALDALSVDDVSPSFERVVAGGAQRVIVDLGRVTLLDSFGVGVLVSLWKRVKARGGHVRVVSANDQPLAVLKILKLDCVLA